jgi:hypothetical protein
VLWVQPARLDWDTGQMGWTLIPSALQPSHSAPPKPPPHQPPGYLEWIAGVTPPYPRMPAGHGAPPPLQLRFKSDVDWVNGLARGAYPSVAKGRPAALLPRATDPLQDGEVGSLPPAPAWVSRLSPQTLAQLRGSGLAGRR